MHDSVFQRLSNRELDCCVIFVFCFFKSRCSVYHTVFFLCVGGWEKLHLRTHTRTHPGGLLQMVAAESVVQVEADNIAVRQAEVLAHCG